MDLNKIHLFTNEFNILVVLKKHFLIKSIFTENKELYKKLKKLNYKILLVKSQKDLINIKVEANLGISYGFGIIFKRKFIKKFKKGIWNIHPGDLPNYRGRHPITAAFINDEKKIGVSIHMVNEEIDRGRLLFKSYVSRTYRDDEISIKKKIFRTLNNALFSALKNFDKKKFIKITKGKYFKPFYRGIKIADSKVVDYKYIYNATKAQKSFGGILVNGKRYLDAMFYFKKKISKFNELIICKNNKKIILVKKK